MSKEKIADKQQEKEEVEVDDMEARLAALRMWLHQIIRLLFPKLLSRNFILIFCIIKKFAISAINH